MARIDNRFCSICSRETRFFNGRCATCVAREAAAVEDAEDNRFASLTLDEQILDLHKRLRAIEKRPTRTGLERY